MNRRQVLKLGAAAGALAGSGLYARHALLPPSRSKRLRPVQELAVELFDSLEGEQRARVCVEYDHPLRQYHNRGVWGGGLRIFGSGLDRGQRRLLTDLFHAGLSEAGRERVPNEYFTNWPGVHLMNVLLCGDPRSGPFQLVLSGPHLNLRLGGASREGVAFGGPQVYGDQRGDGRAGLPGNLYRFQHVMGRDLFALLDEKQRATALLPAAPIQTQIELQGKNGVLPGVSVAGLSTDAIAAVRGLIDGILSTYPPDDVAYAWRCLDANGGIDALHLAYYADGEVAQSGEYQIFRLEGPAAVFHFRGAPHVHAFVNVAMDGDHPLSVGAELGVNPTPLEGAGVQKLFEAAMRAQTGAELAWYPLDGVVGRLRAGPIRTGDVYTLESWQDGITVAEIEGADLPEEACAVQRRESADAIPTRVYTLATTNDAADSLHTRSGSPGPLLRDATIAYLKTRGFSGA